MRSCASGRRCRNLLTKKRIADGRATRIHIANADYGDAIAFKSLDSFARYGILHRNFSSRAFFSQKLSKHSGRHFVQRSATGNTADPRLTLPFRRLLGDVTLLRGGCFFGYILRVLVRWCFCIDRRL